VTTVLPGDNRAYPDPDPDLLKMILEDIGDDLLVDSPEFASWDYLNLPVDDPRRRAALVRAALGWWTAVAFGTGIPCEVIDREINRRMSEAAFVVSAAHDWRKQASQPTRDQLDRRRYWWAAA
jgi:hypothetical protein